MKASELKDPTDKYHAQKDEKRRRAFTQPDKPVKAKASIVIKVDPFVDEHEY